MRWFRRFLDEIEECVVGLRGRDVTLSFLNTARLDQGIAEVEQNSAVMRIARQCRAEMSDGARQVVLADGQAGTHPCQNRMIVGIVPGQAINFVVIALLDGGSDSNPPSLRVG